MQERFEYGESHRTGLYVSAGALRDESFHRPASFVGLLYSLIVIQDGAGAVCHRLRTTCSGPGEGE